MPPHLGVCPSGQRERAVNPSAQPTEVRILPPPFRPAPTPARQNPPVRLTFVAIGVMRGTPPVIAVDIEGHVPRIGAIWR